MNLDPVVMSALGWAFRWALFIIRVLQMSMVWPGFLQYLQWTGLLSLGFPKDLGGRELFVVGGRDLDSC